MPRKLIARWMTDCGMTIALLLLMVYERIGQTAHEWIGIVMFVLFILHHMLNRTWSRNLFHGRYTVFRMMQTTLVVLILLSMLGSMLSGVILSRHVFTFLPIAGGRSLARSLHMLSAYWGFVLMSLHLGLHWRIILSTANRLTKQHKGIHHWVLRGIAVLIAGYGLYAFMKREIGSYMLLQSHFVFFDFEEPLMFFFADYLAVMGLWVFIGYYLAQVLQQRKTHAPF